MNYNAYAFPTAVNPHGQLNFRTEELAHALFATGRAPGDRYRYGSASTWEWLYRTSLIPAYIRRRPYGALTRSRLAHELDRSELVGLSYALGTAMTAIFCRRVLDVSHLLHIDRYASTYGVVFGTGRKRADLFGRAPSGWVVAEAKGRSRAMERTLPEKLLDQKRSVLSIESGPPWLALGCVASFPTGQNLVVDAFDPDEPAEDAIRLDHVTRDRYLYAYYQPFINALQAGDRLEDTSVEVPFETVNFGGFRVQLGLLRGVADLAREISANDPAGFGEQVSDLLTSARERETRMFSDGSIIQTDWTEAIQAQDWLIGPE
ncbi:hypothetical protein [Nocardia abscessus]|uniref:hypothetical protein n=1 Tax=Nocardia abscessus TaxID=120957 RepID=UPI0012FBFEFC|nr:hypothetical protein [Nocardia abscessus]MCC3332943.1 hypothetical protein [Nocardia abscessus]